jgi:hypothetical protein
MGGTVVANLEFGTLSCPLSPGNADDGAAEIGVPPIGVFRSYLREKLAPEKLSSASLEDLLRDHFAVRAHFRKRDVFVTGSRRLLRLAHKLELTDANILAPVEAIALAGLYLRSHGDFTVAARPGWRFTLSQAEFYWVLSQLWLRDTWPLMSCVQLPGCKAGQLGARSASGVLRRCSGALHARDLVLGYLYGRHSNDSMETVYFHFEHLCLLLSGAFDCLGSLLALTTGNEELLAKRRDLRDPDFARAIRTKVPGELGDLTLTPRFHDVLTLVYEPRNLIHALGLTPVTVVGKQAGRYHQFDPEMFERIRSAAGSVGGWDVWGLRDGAEFDVFRYSQAVAREALELLNDIMTRLPLGLLFDSGRPPGSLPKGPLAQDPYGRGVGDNICLLGGIEPPSTRGR